MSVADEWPGKASRVWPGIVRAVERGISDRSG
jgi:hypothetical protein